MVPCNPSSCLLPSLHFLSFLFPSLLFHPLLSYLVCFLKGLMLSWLSDSVLMVKWVNVQEFNDGLVFDFFTKQILINRKRRGRVLSWRCCDHHHHQKSSEVIGNPHWRTRRQRALSMKNPSEKDRDTEQHTQETQTRH